MINLQMFVRYIINSKCDNISSIISAAEKIRNMATGARAHANKCENNLESKIYKYAVEDAEDLERDADSAEFIAQLIKNIKT